MTTPQADLATVAADLLAFERSFLRICEQARPTLGNTAIPERDRGDLLRVLMLAQVGLDAARGET